MLDKRGSWGQRQKGFALVIVLWTSVLLAVMAGSLLQTSRSDVYLAQSLLDSTRAELLADGAFAAATFALLNSQGSGAWRADGTVYAWREGTAEIRVRASEEAGRIDLNAAPTELLRAFFLALGSAPGEAAALSDAIADFRDPDSDRQPQGLEDRDYPEDRYPLGAKDAAFEITEELMRIPLVTGALYDKAAPYLTTLSGRARPDPKSAAPLVRAVLENRQLAADSGTAAALPPFGGQELGAEAQVLREGNGQEGSARGLYRIEAEAHLPGGALFAREAVILFTGVSEQPYRRLLWHRGKARLFPLESE